MVAFRGGGALGTQIVVVFGAVDAGGLGPEAAFFIGEVLEFCLESAEVLLEVDDFHVFDIDGSPGFV